MNKERFHNALALKLGYDRIINDRSISIKIDDTTTDPVVIFTSEESQKNFSFNASDDVDIVYAKMQKTMGTVVEEHDMKVIVDAVHQAYTEANKHRF